MRIVPDRWLKSEADTTPAAQRLMRSFGDVAGFTGKSEKQVGKAWYLGQSLPFVEGSEHRFLAAIAGDDGRHAGYSAIDQGGACRLRVLKGEFLHAAVPPAPVG